MHRPEDAEGLRALSETIHRIVVTSGPRQVTNTSRIIDAHRQQVLALLHRVGDIDGESGQAAAVLADRLSIQPDGGVGIDALEHQEDAFIGRMRRNFDRLAVPGRAVTAAIDHLPGIGIALPVVRNRNGGPGGVGKSRRLVGGIGARCLA